MVVYNSSHRLLTIRGVSQGSADRWGIGLRFVNPFGIGVAPTQAEVDETVTPIRTWFTTTGMFFPLTTTVDEIKLANIGLDGKYPPGQDSAIAVIGAAIAGTTSSAALPPQTSFVVSLTTALPRGRGHIGRVYLPAMRSSLPLTNGQLGTAEVDGFLGFFRTLVLALQGTSGLGGLGVYSPLGAPTQTVTGFRGGRVLDTQRRRRNDIDESYRLLAL